MTVIELENAIKYNQEKYYSGISEISDAEFDEMWDELKRLDPENKIFTEVFDFSKDFPKESHSITAGSQNKVNDLASLKKWLKNIKGEKVSISYKLDGHSIVLYYTNGKLDKALTRGDGKTGSNVTKNVIKMHNVKTQLKSDFTGALRGEILCLKPEKDKYFPEMKNCRNAVSVMHRIDGIGCEHLTFIPYEVFHINGTPFKTEQEKIEFLKDEGFESCQVGMFTKDAENIINLRDDIFSDTSNLPFDIDGLVIKQNEIDYEDLKNVRPKTQTALKPVNERFQTTILDIEWQNTNGTIVPVAVLKPTFWKGATISRASLHNLAEIIRLGIEIGDDVYVERRNEIIPKVVGKV